MKLLRWELHWEGKAGPFHWCGNRGSKRHEKGLKKAWKGEWERLGDSWGQAMPFYLGRVRWRGGGVRTSVLRRVDILAGSNLTDGWANESLTLWGTMVIFRVHSKSLAWYKSEAIAKVLDKSESTCSCIMKDCFVEHMVKPLSFNRGDFQAQVMLWFWQWTRDYLKKLVSCTLLKLGKNIIQVTSYAWKALSSP